MFYKKTEQYRFAIPKEHSAYLAFKNRLSSMGIKYIEEGGHTEATITVIVKNNFDVDEDCSILQIANDRQIRPA